MRPQYWSDNASKLHNHISYLRKSIDPLDLKEKFQDTIRDYKFCGYFCDKSISEILEDNEILNPDRYIKLSSDYNSSSIYRDTIFIHEIKNYKFGPNKKFEYKKLNKRIDKDIIKYVVGRKCPFLLILDSPSRFRKDLMEYKDIISHSTDEEHLDYLCIPFRAHNGEKVFFWLLCKSKPTIESILSGVILVNTFHTTCCNLLDNIEKKDSFVSLGETQLECIQWAVAGKTLEDISTLTGISRRTVRYHIEEARRRYGYATREQTLVRAAKDYHLDPLGPHI